MTTSAPATQVSISGATVQPICSMPMGIMVPGAQMVTFAPILDKPIILDRATLEWEISPTMETFNPSNLPFSSWMVIISKRAWEGWAWVPSPALITAQFTHFATWQAAPEDECRITMISGVMDSRVLTVSLNVSPLTMLEDDLDMATVSAERRFPASSKDNLVRVDGSWKKST